MRLKENNFKIRKTKSQFRLINYINKRGKLEFINEIYNYVTNEHFLKNLITFAGYPGLFLIIFSETGLLVGFFLPGDSLLVTAGLLAATTVTGAVHETYLNIY